MPRNEFRHSAEGTHWTKRNHKYIRKEGNRYIYPEDLQTSSGRREGIDKRQYTMEENIKSKYAARRNALSNQGNTNYKQLGLQKANRTAAANGVSDHYRMDDGTYFQPHEKSNYQFAKYNNSKAAINKMHRAKAANGVGAKNQEYSMQKSAEHQRKQAHIKEEANRQKRNIASYRQGNTGNVSDLTKIGVNRAKRKAAAGSGQQVDYRSVSSNHAGKEHVNRQANVDYKQYVNRPETVQRKAEKQRSENQKRINRVAFKNLMKRANTFGQFMVAPGLVNPFYDSSKNDEKAYAKAEKKAKKKAEKATQRALDKSKKKRIKALKKWEKENKKKIETTNALARDHGIAYRRH